MVTGVQTCALPILYVVSGNQAAKMPVTKGRKKNAYMEITQGLTQGNEVILQSSQSLEDGMKVRVLTVKKAGDG